MIYFMRAGESGHVKIGWTKDEKTLENRRRTLQTGQPFQLIVIRTIEAMRPAEAWLHGFFSGVKIYREWFKFQDEMLTIDVPDNATGRRTNVIHVRLSDEALATLTARARDQHRPLASLLALILEDEAIAPRSSDTRSSLEQDAHVEGLAMRAEEKR